MSRTNSFLGPSAPWVEEGDTVFPLLLRSSADALADRLEARVTRLRSDGVSTDEVLTEIRRQIAVCAFGDVIQASDLADLMLEIVWAREHAASSV